MNIIASFLTVLFCTFACYSVCPVCTVAVGAGLEGARLLGVDDVITGIWAGGLTLSLFFWTVSFLKKKGINNLFLQIIFPFLIMYSMLFLVYLLPGVNFGQFTLFGIDKFLLGTIVGTVSFYFGARLYIKIKRENEGHAKFPFQKVVVPLSFLVFSTAVFALIVYL